MIEIGRLCVKTAGRDARLKCVIVGVVDKNLVLIDGQTRRRKCNVAHLEPLAELVKISKNASHEEVVSALKQIGIEVKERKQKAKTERPKKQRKGKKKQESEKEIVRKGKSTKPKKAEKR